MRIIVAEDIGFCFGVQRALQMVNSKIEGHERVYTLGEVVHNRSVIKSLEEKGVTVIEETIPHDAESSVLVIRAHGVPKRQLEAMKKRFKEVVDTTCPIVLKLFITAEEMHRQGYKIIVFGKKEPSRDGGSIRLCTRCLDNHRPNDLRHKELCFISNDDVCGGISRLCWKIH